MFSLVSNFQDKNCYTKRFENGRDGWGGSEDFNSVFSDYERCIENTNKSIEDNMVQFSPDFSCLDKLLHLDEPKKDQPIVPLASLGIIQNYARGIKRLYGTTAFEPVLRRKLSTEEILRLAGEKFILTSSGKADRLRGRTLPNISLSPSESKDVNMVHQLLDAADKISHKKYELARKYLDQCDSSSSDNGNQMDRIVYYFSKALREKVDREMGHVSCKDSLKEQAIQVEENLMKARPVILAFYKEIPFYQISLYAGIQVIVERVAHARRVHVIDLDIRSGIHTSVLMQALVDRQEYPIELLTITAVATKLKWVVEETGNRLRDFAKSINLPFLFNIVTVTDFQTLNKEQFEINPEEAVAVNASYTLRTMVGRQDELEYLMRVLKSISPCVMAVTELEGKLNSPGFVNRFTEALFYYGALFDCIEDITSRDSQLRMELESIYLSYGIRNLIVAEGDERTIRHVNLYTWREFFSGFDMKEEEVSSSSVLQANFVAKTYECCNSCTIYKEDKSLLVGWKGMPLQHVSAWTFEESDPSSDQ